MLISFNKCYSNKIQYIKQINCYVKKKTATESVRREKRQLFPNKLQFLFVRFTDWQIK